MPIGGFEPPANGLGNRIELFHSIKRLAGIPDEFRIHDLRHNYGTELASSGVQQTTISKLLGHSQLRTSERYVHATDPAQRAAVELIKLK